MSAFYKQGSPAYARPQLFVRLVKGGVWHRARPWWGRTVLPSCGFSVWPRALDRKYQKNPPAKGYCKRCLARDKRIGKGAK
jgi:hypothetical protein